MKNFLRYAMNNFRRCEKSKVKVNFWRFPHSVGVLWMLLFRRLLRPRGTVAQFRVFRPERRYAQRVSGGWTSHPEV